AEEEVAKVVEEEPQEKPAEAQEPEEVQEEPKEEPSEEQVPEEEPEEPEIEDEKKEPLALKDSLAAARKAGHSVVGKKFFGTCMFTKEYLEKLLLGLQNPKTREAFAKAMEENHVDISIGKQFAALDTVEEFDENTSGVIRPKEKPSYSRTAPAIASKADKTEENAAAFEDESIDTDVDDDEREPNTDLDDEDAALAVELGYDDSTVEDETPDTDLDDDEREPNTDVDDED
ncbi:MAG: hypothetical protein IKT95_07860, partial [Spirochaetales bacterium]|nr:hypothetical protein [Spirochaetales bacterium]